MNETRQLAEFVATTPYESLPAEVVQAIKVYILDDLACGFAGARTAWADIVADQARQTSMGPCSVFARPYTVSASQAALVNGVMVGGFECDHPYLPGSCHPSGAVFPAVVAAAQQKRVDGRTFLTAMALGYELLCRVGAAATRAVEDERGFHGPGTNAAFGAAAGAGKVLGLSANAIANALGIAGSHGGGLLEFFREGAMTKRLHLGRGAQMGLESALLAADGFTGPTTVLEGSRGFLAVYSPHPEPERLTEGLGDRYLMLGMTLKSYPCHVTFQAMVDGIRGHWANKAFNPMEVQGVRVRTSGRVLEERFGNRAPTTMLGAQYSLPWSLALACCRDVAQPASWREEDLSDPEVRRIAALIDLGEGPHTELTLTIASKEHSFRVHDWKGSPTNPYTYEELAAKFARYAEPVLDKSRIVEITERVAALDKEPDVAPLIGLIGGTS